MIGISEELTVIRPGGALSPRCAGVLEAALAGRLFAQNMAEYLIDLGK